MIKINKNLLHTGLCALSIFTVIVGLFLGRFVISLGCWLMASSFLLNLFFEKKMFFSLKKSFPFLIISILFVVSALSYFWSDNKAEWFSRTSVKIPFLILPLFFISNINHLKKIHWPLIVTYIALIIGSSMVSLGYYFADFKTINENYIFAKVIKVAFYDDHVRYSFAIVVAVIFCMHGIIHQKKYRKYFILIAFYLAVYLHVLASKTGLICLYFISTFFILYYFKRQRFWIFLSLPIIAICAYFLLPTLKTRVRYIVYDFSIYSKNNYLDGLSDGTRFYSIQAGINTFKKNIILGVGFGDIYNENKNEFAKMYPQAKQKDIMLPSNILVLFAAATGIIGLILILIMLLYPFTIKWIWRYKPTLSYLFTHSFLLMIDDSTEGQYGVIVLALFYCWFIWIAQEFSTDKKLY